MAYWTLSETYENWKIGLEKGVWGVSEKAKGLWRKIQPGDKAVFYAVKTGIIGYGTILEKYVDDTPLWPQEKKQRKAIWPYRLKIKTEKTYTNPKPKPKNLLVAFAINKLPKELYEEIANL